MIPTPVLGQIRPVDGYLIQIANQVKEILNNDNDVIAICDGFTGEGKSTLAQTLAALVDEDFNINKIFFECEDFKNGIINAKKKTTIILDEGNLALNTRRAMSSINVTLTSLLAEIRQKNLFIIICLPSIFDLDKNIAIHRSLFLLHAHAKNGKRGFWKFYGRKTKNRLFTNDYARRTYQYIAKPTWFGRFSKGYVVDEEAYRKKKDDVLKRFTPVITKQEEKPDSAQTVKQLKIEWLLKLKKAKKLTGREYEALGLGSQNEFYRLLKSIDDNELFSICKINGDTQPVEVSRE